MSHRKKGTIVGSLIAGVLICSLLTTVSPVVASSASMSITPATQSVANGATNISISIVASTETATRGWGADVHFNATQLQETGYAYGSTFYASNYGSLFNNTSTVNNTTGSNTNLAQTLLGGSGGPNGTGTLVTIIFRAVSSNCVDAITLGSDSGLADANANALNPTINNGTVIVGTSATTPTSTTTRTTTTPTTTMTSTKTTTTTPTAKTTSTTRTSTTSATTTTPTTTTMVPVTTTAVTTFSSSAPTAANTESTLGNVTSLDLSQSMDISGMLHADFIQGNIPYSGNNEIVSLEIASGTRVVSSADGSPVYYFVRRTPRPLPETAGRMR